MNIPVTPPIPPYRHTPLFPLGQGRDAISQDTREGVRVEKVLGEEILIVPREAIRALAEAAFTDINHLLRPAHLRSLAHIVEDPEASDNDKFVAYDFLKNANIAAGGVLPMCQDTGTAIIMGKKGRLVWTDGADEGALARGRARRVSETEFALLAGRAAVDVRGEEHRDNMPAQVEIYAEGDARRRYKFLFIAKGGGSANKTFPVPGDAVDPDARTNAGVPQGEGADARHRGVSALPPRHRHRRHFRRADHENGEARLDCKYLRHAADHGHEDGHAFRDLEMEREIHKMTQSLGVGAQFGGKYFCHDVRVIRLPRHGASLPIGLGVSCSADRQALGKITRDGVFLEELEHNPAKYLPEVDEAKLGGEVVKIDLNRPMKEILAELAQISDQDAALAHRHR